MKEEEERNGVEGVASFRAFREKLVDWKRWHPDIISQLCEFHRTRSFRQTSSSFCWNPSRFEPTKGSIKEGYRRFRWVAVDLRGTGEQRETRGQEGIKTLFTSRRILRRCHSVLWGAS